LNAQLGLGEGVLVDTVKASNNSINPEYIGFDVLMYSNEHKWQVSNLVMQLAVNQREMGA